jgi:hypothetical protein
MASRLGSLSNDHIRTAGKRVLGIAPRLHLAHEQAANALYGMGKGLRITKGEKNRARPVLQDLIEKLRTRNLRVCSRRRETHPLATPHRRNRRR